MITFKLITSVSSTSLFLRLRGYQCFRHDSATVTGKLFYLSCSSTPSSFPYEAHILWENKFDTVIFFSFIFFKKGKEIGIFNLIKFFVLSFAIATLTGKQWIWVCTFSCLLSPNNNKPVFGLIHHLSTNLNPPVT